MDIALPNEVAGKTNRALRMIDWLEARYERWGRPPFDVKANTFWEMVFDIIKAWEKSWPDEMADWEHDRKIDLSIERPLSESAKKGIKKMIAYPPHLFMLLKTYWPTGRFSNKEFVVQFQQRFPIFRNSNYT